MQSFDDKTLAWKLQIKKFGKLIGAIAILSFLLMILGAAVRATDSGLACPDWPLCYNQLVPSFDMHIFLEWLHRAVAGVVTILVVSALFILKRHKILRFEFGRPLAFAFLLLIIQIILGALTIFHLLDPKVVSFHLINALFFFSVLVWIHHMAAHKKAPDRGDDSSLSADALSVPPYFTFGLLAFCIGVLCQIFLGGMVSTNHAGLACPDFPKCHGYWLPPLSFLVGLQILHRFMAFGLVAIALLLSYSCYKIKLPRNITFFIRFLPYLMVFQIGLGMINVFFYLPRWASIAHLTTALVIYTLSLKSLLATLWLTKNTSTGSPSLLNIVSHKVVHS